MKFQLFTVILMSDFLLLLGVTISIFFPKFRIWPPPKKGSWQQWVSWTLFTIDMFGVLLLGILDFESIGYGHWSRFVIGCLAVATGLGIGIWGIRILSVRQSLGEEGKMMTAGPYEYTRNPQYVGFIIFYIGVILIMYSFMALVTGIFLILLFLILPFSEEPWLKQKYGKQYEEYCKKVPRFIGYRSFKPKTDINR